MQVISVLIVIIISICNNYYLNSKILIKDDEAIRKKTIFYCIIHSIIIFGAYVYVNSILRMIISLFINIIFNKIYFSKSLTKSVISAVVTYIIMIIAEMISISLFFIFDKLSFIYIESEIELNIYMNFFIMIICFVFINIKSIKYNLNKVIENVELKIDKNYFAVILLIFETISLISLFSYYNYNNTVNLIINYLIIVFIGIIAYALLKIKNDNIEIYNKYKIASYNLREYEKLLTEQRILNHDTKNDFIALRGMVEQNENNELIIDYITELIKYRIKDNQDLLNQTSCIPLGGLQAIVYQKLLLAKEKKIRIFLNISKDLKKIKKLNLNVDTLRNLCTIIGIFLDNSIEANDNVKDKEINLTMLLKNKKMYIKISNSYNNRNINDSKVSRHSTKGNGRGNGLKIVNKLIEENKIFHNDKEISGCVFQQILIIDI